jgi:hypothetical protein
MANVITKELIGLTVAARIVVPGEPVNQHNGIVRYIDENILVLQNPSEQGDLTTVYNMSTVAVLQYLTPETTSKAKATA